jgi:hypothetical protein
MPRYFFTLPCLIIKSRNTSAETVQLCGGGGGGGGGGGDYDFSLQGARGEL